MSDKLIDRLRDTPNWMREEYQGWKDCGKSYDRAPFEAADRIEALEAEIARLREALRKCKRIMENRQPDKMPDGIEIVRAALEEKNDDG